MALKPEDVATLENLISKLDDRHKEMEPPSQKGMNIIIRMAIQWPPTFRLPGHFSFLFF